jgi:hypothetical protein
MAIVLLAIAGILVGGIFSLAKQGANRVVLVGMGLAAALAAVGGVLWLVPAS